MVVYPCIMHYVWFVESYVWLDGFPKGANGTCIHLAIAP
ncbi:hypothetical protein QE385_003652 [Sphingomonas sp. SORGH_AS 950]|nr:hypothetical protein [Sphingomonas sp. SORGH_AS_0950]